MLLEVAKLQVGYGDAVAVWDVSLQVAEGEIVSVIGPNGAGKTTLINALAGLLRVGRGSIRLDGRELAGIAPHRVCAAGIALVPEGRRLFVRMTVEENLEIGCYLPRARALRDRTLARVYDLFPILRDKRLQAAGELSGGQQQMVAIGRALMAQPRIVLFDEPSLGLAPAVVDDVFAVIARIRAEGVAVLLVEQSVRKALNAADRAYVLEQGRITATGLPQELAAQPHVREAYLGI